MMIAQAQDSVNLTFGVEIVIFFDFISLLALVFGHVILVKFHDCLVLVVLRFRICLVAKQYLDQHEVLHIDCEIEGCSTSDVFHINLSMLLY